MGDAKKFAAIRRLGGFRLEPIISSLIGAAESGDAAATNPLFSALYTELHRLAKRELARRGTGKPECNHASARGAFQWITFKLGDIEVTGLADKHQCQSTPDHNSDRASTDLQVETRPPNNVIGFDNAIQIIETGGLRIAIWGDNRGVPDPSLDHYLKNVDVLILPVETILTRAEVDAIVRKYDPRAVIPAHYFLNGLTTEMSGLESADGWVNDRGKAHHAEVRRLDRADLTLNAAGLKGSHHRIYYFGNHFENK